MIEEIVMEGKKLNRGSGKVAENAYSLSNEVNPFPGPHIPYPIPNSLTGLVIGKNGDTIK